MYMYLELHAHEVVFAKKRFPLYINFAASARPFSARPLPPQSHVKQRAEARQAPGRGLWSSRRLWTLTLPCSNRVTGTEHSICKLKGRASTPLHSSSLYSFILHSHYILHIHDFISLRLRDQELILQSRRLIEFDKGFLPRWGWICVSKQKVSGFQDLRFEWVWCNLKA